VSAAAEIHTTSSSDPRFGVTIHVGGEVDVMVAPLLQAEIEAALSDGSGPIAVDCRRLTFIGSSAVETLLHLANEAHRQERAVFLCNVAPVAMRVLRITGVDLLFPDEVRTVPLALPGAS
jgi:anti-anti-sigma factor